MALTPVEIRHIRLRKAFFGYQIRQTDELLSDIVDSFEDVWRDRADLADKIEQLGGELVRYRELEQLLRTTLISAERASQQMTDQTRRETESVLSEARAEAREILREATAERERLNVEINRVRAQLAAVLSTIGTDAPTDEPDPKESTLETPPVRPPSPPPPVQAIPPQAAPPPPQSVAPAPPPAPAAQPPVPRPATRPEGPTSGQVATAAAVVANGSGWPVPS
ncbi:MAG: DivIVA domain-containing protein [Gaiellaceae bacterium]